MSDNNNVVFLSDSSLIVCITLVSAYSGLCAVEPNELFESVSIKGIGH